jgi:glycosyltransferase involved in cell wall biosynthesis
LKQKVKLIPRISPEALQKLTPLADVGISFEEDSNLNYTFALPNKLFDYIQANVPVIVSDLPEMKNIVIQYNIGEVIKNRAPKELATQLNEILIKGKNHYKIQLQNAANEFNWENESKKLIEIFKNLE